MSKIFYTKLQLTRTYLLDLLFVSLFEVGDVVCSLLGLLDLLPGFHLLLLQQCNTVGKQLGIAVNVLSSLLDLGQTFNLGLVCSLIGKVLTVLLVAFH
jgi:hypothetical protein